MIPGRVTVGFLHPGHYAACFADSLTNLLFFDAANHQRIVSHEFGQVGIWASSAGIVSGRNSLAKATLDSDAEWLFMVDSDMGFAHDAVERLIEAADPVERPVVGGLAFAHKGDGRKEYNGVRYKAQPTLYDFVDMDDKVGFAPRFEYPKNELVPVSGTGGAIILIHRSVLERIRDKYGEVWFEPITHPKGPTTFSEDLSFCVRVAGCDFPIFVHTGVTTTHDKGGVFLDEEFFEAQQRLAAIS